MHAPAIAAIGNTRDGDRGADRTDAPSRDQHQHEQEQDRGQRPRDARQRERRRQPTRATGRPGRRGCRDRRPRSDRGPGVGQQRRDDAQRNLQDEDRPPLEHLGQDPADRRAGRETQHGRQQPCPGSATAAVEQRKRRHRADAAPHRADRAADQHHVQALRQRAHDPSDRDERKPTARQTARISPPPDLGGDERGDRQHRHVDEQDRRQTDHRRVQIRQDLRQRQRHDRPVRQHEPDSQCDQTPAQLHPRQDDRWTSHRRCAIIFQRWNRPRNRAPAKPCTSLPAALDEAELPDDEPFRRAVREHVEFGSQVAQQNSRARTDAELHPIREVPHWDWPG